MYTSGASLGEKKSVSLGNQGGAAILPPENLFLAEPDGLTRPFRIGRRPAGDKVDFELWCEFADQPANITHLCLNDCNVSEDATMNLRFYGIAQLDEHWDVSLDADTQAVQDKFVFQPVGGPYANTVIWHPDHLELVDYVGYLFVAESAIPGFIQGDGRYMTSWRTIPSDPNHLPGISTVQRFEDPYTVVQRKGVSAINDQAPHLIFFVAPGNVGWTGKIYGVTARKEIDGTLVTGEPCIGPQSNTAAFGYDTYTHIPERGQGNPYPINILHLLPAPVQVQAVIIEIDDPSAATFDAHNLHLAGGYVFKTPPGLTLDPLLPKIARLDTGYGVPQDGNIVRRWSMPLKYLTIAQSAELNRLLAKAASRPVVCLAFEDVPKGGTRQLWTVFGYVEKINLKAEKGDMFGGTMTVTELRVSAS